jgi:hypothetical protein
MTGSGARRVIDAEDDFAVGTYFEAVAYNVPTSDRFPDGVKYSYQYGKTGGETIFRYDNAPDHHTHAPHHHKHTRDGRVIGVDFSGLNPLFQRFLQEVTDDVRQRQ